MQDPDSRFYSLWTWSGVLLLALASAVATVRGGFWSALPASSFLVALVVVLSRATTPPRAVMAIAVWSTAFNAAGWTWNWYHRIVWYDEMGHLLGTLAATLFLACYVYRPLMPLWPRNSLAVSAAVICLGVTVGAVWELVEWTIFHFVGPNPERVIDDILSDLVFDAIGAAIAVPVGYWSYGRSNQRRKSQVLPPSSPQPFVNGV